MSDWERGSEADQVGVYQESSPPVHGADEGESGRRRTDDGTRFDVLAEKVVRPAGQNDRHPFGFHLEQMLPGGLELPQPGEADGEVPKGGHGPPMDASDVRSPADPMA
jgi:hypothetical protein